MSCCTLTASVAPAQVNFLQVKEELSWSYEKAIQLEKAKYAAVVENHAKTVDQLRQDLSARDALLQNANCCIEELKEKYDRIKVLKNSWDWE